MIRSALPGFLATFGLLAIAGSAPAQTRHDSNAPIDVSANAIELQDKQQRAVFTGGAVFRQGTMTLTADRVVIAYSGQITDGAPQATRIDATGNVTLTQPDKTAKSRFAVYDINRRVVTMIGGVRLTQGANTLNGGRLSIDLDTGRATLDGSGVGGGTTAPDGAVQQSGGRVTGRFSVPKRN